MLGDLFAQPLSMSFFSLPLAWSPSLHIPYISSPNQCLFFAAHAHAIAACFAVVSIISSIPSLSLNSLLGTLSFTLTLHIHLTILISAHGSATSFSFLTGQVSLPCSILLRTVIRINTTKNFDADTIIATPTSQVLAQKHVT